MWKGAGGEIVNYLNNSCPRTCRLPSCGTLGFEGFPALALCLDLQANGAYFDSRSAITANSVSLAAVTPMRSKHSATMLFVAVSKLISRSIVVTCLRL